MSWIEQTAGIALVLLILLDVFLTVLYARIAAGIVGYRMAVLVWKGFRRLARHGGDRRGYVLSFCGPLILILLLILWNALGRLKQAGIATRENPEAGVAQYISLRTNWQNHVANLASGMLFRMEEIDPAAGDSKRRLRDAMRLRKAS